MKQMTENLEDIKLVKEHSEIFCHSRTKHT